jgi:hypothetical protein
MGFSFAPLCVRRGLEYFTAKGAKERKGIQIKCNNYGFCRFRRRAWRGYNRSMAYEQFSFARRFRMRSPLSVRTDLRAGYKPVHTMVYPDQFGYWTSGWFDFDSLSVCGSAYAGGAGVSPYGAQPGAPSTDSPPPPP